MHIAMLLTNAFRPDPRVARAAAALTRAGHRVTIVCWDRESQYEPEETVDGYQVSRIQNVRTVYGAGVRQILHTPRFWQAAMHRVQKLAPDVIHCHDLDTLPAGWWLKKRIGAHLVYDAHEDYPAMMSLYLPRMMVKMLSRLEKHLLGRVDHTITASTVFADKLSQQGVSPVTTIGNYPSLAPYDAVQPDDVLRIRSQYGLDPDDLMVTYVGGFSRNRKLLPLIKAARQLPGVHVTLWGKGHQQNQVEEAADKVPNVQYLGWLPSDQVPLHMKAADIIYYCLRQDYPGAIYNAPNTLSQAMAAGRPIIANDVGDLGRIVRQTGCGVLVPAATPDEIRQAIQELSSPTLRRQMGQAGRKAAETQYNSSVIDRQQEAVYANLKESDR